VWCKDEEGGDDSEDEEDEVYEPSDAASEEESSEEDSDESNWSAENESSGWLLKTVNGECPSWLSPCVGSRAVTIEPAPFPGWRS